MESISCVLRHSRGGLCLPADAPAPQSTKVHLAPGPSAEGPAVGQREGEATHLLGLCRSHQLDLPNRLCLCRLNVHLVLLPAAASRTSSIQTVLQVRLENSQLRLQGYSSWLLKIQAFLFLCSQCSQFTCIR